MFRNWIIRIVWALGVLSAQSATYYVDCNRPDNTGDGLSWATAKRTIQAAVNAAASGDTIRVGPGTYGEGTTVTPSGSLMNRVVCTKNVTIESTDGAAATIIKGAFDTGSGDPYGRGPNAVRCVYMTSGTLKGFTLTGGATGGVNTEDNNNRGGGFLSIYVATPLVYDCIVSNNASHRAGGAFQGTFHRCLIAQNYASQNGSGVRASRLYDSLIVFNTGLGAVAYSQSTNDVVNCTIARNSSKALEQASAANSIIVENGSTANQGNYYVAHCLIDFTPTSGYGLNNITGGGARFVDSANGDFRLLADSPALDAGNASMTGTAPAPAERTDVYGHPRVQGAGLDLGAVEGAYPGAVVTVSASGSGTLDPAGSFLLPTLPTQLVFTATPGAGAALRHFTVNGAKQPDSGSTLTLNLTRPGGYAVQGDFLAVSYVDAAAGDDGNDGASPATAWRTLQHAVDTVPLGGMVLAAPGVYAEGRTFNALHSNRVSITRDVVLKSSAGAEQTFIVGAKDDTPFADPYGRGTNAVRCVYMSKGSLEGFTLTGGASSVSVNDSDTFNVRGGGLYAEGLLQEVWDCILSNNVASRGSAAWGGTIRRSRIANNRTTNSGNSVIRTGYVYDSLIVNNISGWVMTFSGARAINCTIADNTGGGINDLAVALNSIIYGNGGIQVGGGALCTNSLTGDGVRPGAGNISADPRFVDAPAGDYRLRADSPCVNAGSIAFLTHKEGADYAGAPRVQGGGVNMGALETAVSVVTATSTSGGTVNPAGSFLFTGDLHFTATPWPGRAFRYFEVNGEPVPGSDTNLTINAEAFSGDSAVLVRAVFQDGFYVDAAAGDDTNSGLESGLPLKTLQAAASRALDGDTVRVAPGAYDAGFAVAAEGALTNRLAITNDITVTALDGPENTFIVGARSLNANGCGSDAVRCVYLSAGTLQGFTVTGGATDTVDGGFENDCGGGIFASTSARIIDCVLSNNIAYNKGGGSSLGTLHRCRVSDNAVLAPAGFGGAVRGSTVYDSLIVNNGGPYAIAFAYLHNVTAYNDSPIHRSSVYNSILMLIGGGNSYTATEPDRKVYSSCLSGTLSANNDGGGNLFTDPLFMNPAAGDFRLHLTSPCINRGNISHYNNGLGFDLLGAARVQGAGLDLGAYEGGIGGARIAASVDGGGTLEPLGVTLYPDLPAQAVFTATPWPGRTLTHFSTNGVALPAGGNTLQLTLTADQALNLTAHFAGTFYADAARPDDSGDGLSWATAKRTLQAAVADAVDNDTVLAAPGLYQEGAAVTPNEKTTGYLMNRVVLTNLITLRSRDGAAVTVIQGAFDTGSGDPYGRGPNAVRCVYMSKGILQGFTLTGGATDSVNLENENNRGGGVYVPELTYTPQIIDCVITNCASVRGGGIHAGTLRRCVLRDNYASNNSSAIRGSVAYECLVSQNRFETVNGSACGWAWLYSCTVAGNAPARSGDNASFYNCILTEVTASCRHYDSCVVGGMQSPVTNDASFADAPLFVNAAAGDFRLAAGSPCIDRANRAYVPEPFGTDVTGDLRMQNAAVDLGALEHDWRPALAAALDADGVTVSDLTPFVTHAAQTAHVGGSAVYLDGAAARADNQSAITMTAPWHIPYGRSVTLRGEVTGSGALALYEGESLIMTLISGDGEFALKHLTSAQKPFPLRVVYTVGASDAGGALLDAFEGSTGMLFMLK